MFSYFEPNFFEKMCLGKWFLKFWLKSKWREVKICNLATILKRYNSLKVFQQIFYSAYMVQISLQNSGGKVVFLWGSMETPLGYQRE